MDSSCPICLQTIQNLAVLDCCKHIFCKKCIMAWMKRTDSCPLCKQHIGIIITDITSPTHYTQYLPNGKQLYSHYNAKRKAIYVYNLVNHPQYEREVLPNDLKKCPFLKEWILREIETLLPGVDGQFFVSMIMEGLNRYGSREQRIQSRVQEVIGSNTPIFIRELENCVFCGANTIEEYDLVIIYSYPSLAETSSIEIGNVYDTIDDYNLSYQNLVSEYNMIENEIERLKERIPDIEEKAKKRREKLRNYTWKDYKFKSTQKIQEEKNQSSSRQLSDFEDWDTNMY